MKLKHKMGGAVLALALVAGAVPGTISTAAAVETGQLLDKGPKWPHRPGDKVILWLGIAALVAAIVLVTGSKDDRPTSP